EIEEGLPSAVGAQVERDAPLAPVEMQVHQRDAFDDRPGHLPDVVAGRRLDLDDLGPEIDERARDGGRAEHGGLDDAYAGQRRLLVTHGGNLTGRQKRPRAGQHVPARTLIAPTARSAIPATTAGQIGNDEPVKGRAELVTVKWPTTQDRQP